MSCSKPTTSTRRSFGRVFLAGLCGVALAALCASAPAQVREPFNGKNLDGWKAKRGGGQALVRRHGQAGRRQPRQVLRDAGRQRADQRHRRAWQEPGLLQRDAARRCGITLEVMVPKGSNSGIYVMGEYEIQVLDSFGRDKNPGPGDMGAIYGAQPPKNPKYKAPGEWNSYEIHWQAPRFDDKGQKDRQRAAPESGLERRDDPREPGDGEGHAGRRGRQREAAGAADVPGQPRAGGLSQHQDRAAEAVQRGRNNSVRRGILRCGEGPDPAETADRRSPHLSRSLTPPKPPTEGLPGEHKTAQKPFSLERA